MDYTSPQPFYAPTLTYAAARDQIKNGDLLSFRISDTNPLHQLVRVVTKSEYYHSAIAVWLKSRGGIPRLFVAEAHRGGRRLVPLSCYAHVAFDVLECPVNFAAFEPQLMEKVGEVPYGFADYIAVGARILFGVPIRDQNGEICSETVQKMYALGGFEMPNFILAPNELQNYLLLKGVPARFRVQG